MKKPNIKIVTIGNATKDIFINHEDNDNLTLNIDHIDSSYLLIKNGSKIEVNNVHISTGGGATNTAVSFKKFGLDTICYSKIGNDNTGRFIIEDLQRYKIYTKNIKIDNKMDTATSFIISSCKNKSATFIYRGTNNKFSFDELKNIYKLKPNVIYITSVKEDSRESINKFLENIDKNKTIVVNNPGLPELQNNIDIFYSSLKYIDILILNKVEASYCMQLLLEEKPIIAKKLEKKICSNNKKPPLLEYFMSYANRDLTIYNYFDELFKNGPKIAIVTDGEDGAYIASKDFIYYHPSLKVKTINTVGAGDSFGSSFISTLLLTKSIEKAILFAIINSASVVKNFDSKSGLLTFKEIEEISLEIGFSQLQKFPI